MARTVCLNERHSMIVVDTSALMAIILDEAQASACIGALAAEREVLISAGTVAEALIVAARRNVAVDMALLIDEFGFEIVTVTPASARRSAAAYEQWGKGVHPACLNFGDCFSYEVARRYACRLIFVGNGFSENDL